HGTHHRARQCAESGWRGERWTGAGLVARLADCWLWPARLHAHLLSRVRRGRRGWYGGHHRANIGAAHRTVRAARRAAAHARRLTRLASDWHVALGKGRRGVIWGWTAPRLRRPPCRVVSCARSKSG